MSYQSKYSGKQIDAAVEQAAALSADGAIKANNIADGAVTLMKLDSGVMGIITQAVAAAKNAIPIANIVQSDDDADYTSKENVPGMQYMQDEILAKLLPIVDYIGTQIFIAEDTEVQRLMVEKYDTDKDGFISKTEAAAIKTFGSLFTRNKVIKRFINQTNLLANCVPNMGIFNQCSELVKVKWTAKTPKISGHIGGIFVGCNKIQEIDLTGWDTSGVTSFGQTTDYWGLFGMDGDMNQPVSINLTGWNLSQCTSAYRMFGGVHRIGVEFKGIENFSTPKLTNMGQTFFDTYAREINIENWDWSNVTNVTQMFNNCLFLRTVTFPANSQLTLATNFYRFFRNCNELKTINNLGNIDVSNATNIASFFWRCVGLEKVDLTGWNCSKVTTDVTYFMTQTSLQSLVGDLSDEDVMADENIQIMDGLAVNIEINQIGGDVKIAQLGAGSMLALFRGLADLTDGTAKTIKIDREQYDRLTIEMIGIANNKNWKFDIIEA